MSKMKYTIGLLAIVALISGFYAFTSAYNALADDATASVDVGNNPPTVDTMSFNFSGPVTLIEDTSKTIYCSGTVHDLDGASDIQSAAAVYYSSDSAGAGCVADDNNCVQAGACTLSADTATSKTAECSAPVWFNATVTSWTCRITGTDTNSETGYGEDSQNVNALAALAVDNAINYGSVAGGHDTGATNQVPNATTTGNVAIDVLLSGASMTGPGAPIVASHQHYSSSSFTFNTGDTALSGAPTALGSVFVKPTAHPSNSTWATYWGVEVPTGQATGSYSGTDTFTANAV